MFERFLDWWKELKQEKRKIIIGIALGALFVILFGVAIVGITEKEPSGGNFNTIYIESPGNTDSEQNELTENMESTEDTKSTEQTSTETEFESESQSQIVEKEDPQSSFDGSMSNQEGASIDISQVVDNTPTNENGKITLGIDVSEYQGTIDWKKVAESGVDFVMVRVGYRTPGQGVIQEDLNAKYNMQQAAKNGLKIGVYFASTAISKEEAMEEANWVADFIAKYQITYPVVYDCEGFEKSSNRHSVLNYTQRTDNAIAFLDQIVKRGYTPMFYGSKSGMDGSSQWEMSRLQGKYKIWVAQYPGKPYPETEKSSYSGIHAMWQYTDKGTVPGINKKVDMNVAYFGYEKVEGPQNSEKPEDVEVNVEAGFGFKEVTEVAVTAKDETRLRSTPDRSNDSNIVYTLKKGETATLKAVSANGNWARLEFKGQTVYAWYRYLTTDVTVKEPEVEVPDEPTYEELNGIKTKFTEVYDKVTPVASVDHINLRAKPTTQDSVSPVVVQIKHGEELERIGVSTDAEHTYSKIKYNGQILYCVTKYLEVVEESTANTEEIEE